MLYHRENFVAHLSKYFLDENEECYCSNNCQIMVVLGSVTLSNVFLFEQLDSQSRTWNCHGYQTHAKHKFYDILGHKQVESHIKSFYQT